MALHEATAADLSLDEHLDGDGEPVESPETREHVDRLLGRLQRIRAAQAADNDYAAQRMAQIEAWITERDARYERDAAHIESLIAAWHASILATDPKATTISLPNGKSKSRAHGQSFKVTDEADLLGWCDVHAPGLIREKVVRALDKRAIDDYFRAAESQAGIVVVDPTTGEPVPSIIVQPSGRRYSIELAQPETEDAA